jgi:hypothetical protein
LLFPCLEEIRAALFVQRAEYHLQPIYGVLFDAMFQGLCRWSCQSTGSCW